MLIWGFLHAEEAALFYGNPPVTCPEPFRIYAMGDYLYWQATEANLEYAMKQKEQSAAVVSEIDFPFRPAFRLGAGIVFPTYYWQLEANWTHFMEHVHDVQVQIVGGNPSLVGLWMRPVNQDFLTWQRATFFWNLNMNTIDFDLLRQGYTNANFLFVPHIGVKRAWIDQHVHVRYDTTANGFYDVRSTNDMRSLGIRIGCESRLLGRWGFALAASSSAALLYGSFYVHRIDVSSISGDLGVNLLEKIHRFTPVLQGCIALEWAHCFSTYSSKISLALGFEGQIWFHQNQMRTFVSSALPQSTLRANSNLTLQGLTGHACFDF
jgi:hypothetical protein